MINEYIRNYKELAKEGPSLFDFCFICGRNFKNTQESKGHENHCAYAQADLQKQIISDEKQKKYTHETTVFLVSTKKNNEEASCKKPSPANIKRNLDLSYQRAKEKSSTLMVGIGYDTEKVDIGYRNKKWVSGSRSQWTSLNKVELVEKVTEAVNQGLAKYPKDYFRNMGKLISGEVERRRNFISKWSKDYKVLIQDVMGLKNKCAKVSAWVCKVVSNKSYPFHEIEIEPYK